MNAVETMRLASSRGIQLSVEGADLILDAELEPTESVLRAIRHHKAGIVALLTGPDIGRLQGQPASRALERRIVEWLNCNPEPSRFGTCAECAGFDRPEHMVVPFGTEGHGHTWLHPECWEAWHQRRRAMALGALAKKRQA